LFHLEQHIRQVEEKKKGGDERERLLQTLQDIYAQIDEPDGLEGISAHLHVLDFNQQILSHRKAGRWTAAQTWYEIKLAEDPDNVDVQIDLLTCLKESGQHGLCSLLLCTLGDWLTCKHRCSPKLRGRDREAHGRIHDQSDSTVRRGSILGYW
jgi:hypothetical protein